MKIAYLINEYPKISHTFVRREILALEAMGVEVLRFASRRGEGELVDAADREEDRHTRQLLADGPAPLLSAMTQVSLRHPRAFARAAALAAEIGAGSERGVLIHGTYLAQACRLFLWLRESGAQHVHAHFGTNAAAIAMLCRELGGPSYSFTIHGPEEFDKPQLIALPTKIERSAFVAAVSDYGRAQLWRHCGYEHRPKVQVVRCGVDESFLSEPVEPMPELPRLLFVGRLHPQKCPLLLLEAATALHREGRRFELTMVGDGPLKDIIESRVAERGLQDVVKLPGWASGAQIRDWLNRSRVLVLPSLAEGLPVVLMEALALGRPVVATYVAGVPELVTTSCGWLVPAASGQALVEALRSVLDTSVEELGRMGRSGRSRVTAMHDVRRNATKLQGLFARAVAGQPMPDWLSLEADELPLGAADTGESADDANGARARVTA